MSENPWTVLLVEDDADLAVGLRFALEQEGYVVLEADTIAAAVHVMTRRPLDLIILDVGLPDGDGMTLCSRLRTGEFSGGVNPSVPVVFLTARDDEIDVVRGLELGGDDYVAKPFRLKELLSRVKARLRDSRSGSSSRETEGATPISVGPLRIDPRRAEVTISGQPIQLTACEYRLLLALAQHRGQVLSRSQLADRALAVDGGYTDDNTISVYIRRLREKIEIDPSHPMVITTVRGVGYRLE